jgi:hypothetical protein
MEREVGCGAMLGVVAGALFAHFLGAPAAGLIAAGGGGAVVGGVAALLVWIGSADLPEYPIPAPRRSPRRPPGR